jgi:hypothetical protein
MESVRLARSHGLSAKEIGQIEKLIINNHLMLLDGWNAFFAS